MKYLLVIFGACCLFFLDATAQVAPAIKRVDPANWWVGMKNTSVQLMVYGPGAGSLSYAINHPGVTLKRTHKVENPNYAFLDVVITSVAKAGKFNITGTAAGKKASYSYEIKSRSAKRPGTGLVPADLVYLLMPDRFANGDTTNDKFPEMADAQADINSPYLRHGGDIKGIIDHLDYLQQLGVTALWLTPVIENDEQLKQEAPGRMQAGYHGYHFTDHYRVDRRLGGNEAYTRLSQELHRRGMKLIQDAVYNHISDEHWFYKDLPSRDWLNNWPQYTGSSHKEQSLFDPYAAKADKKVLLDGWFTAFLPDLNQKNAFLANYLIQHAIWSTETFALDAWRIDTYKYNDQAFMNRCNQALLSEYPSITLFGESVAQHPLSLSYFVKSNVTFPFKSNLPGTLDFPLNYAIIDALNQPFGWDQGLSRMYQTLANDIVYTDPMKLVTSLDNHDMDRILSVLGGDMAKYRMALTWLLTLRGIPSLYYGTEILMKNFRNPSDAEVRRDFPGGFAGTFPDKFTPAGRNAEENDAVNFIAKLANFRKSTPALHSGKLMQFAPQDGSWVYFRYLDSSRFMIVSNTNHEDFKLQMNRFSEQTAGFSKAVDIMSGDSFKIEAFLTVPPMTSLVLQLQP